MKCVVCKRHLENYASEDVNHPLKGTEFATRGHYGSAVTDDGRRRIVNICDPCIQIAIEEGTCVVTDDDTRLMRRGTPSSISTRRRV